MTEDTADDRSDDPARQADAELGAAVDDAMTAELKRQRARFVQAFMGVDRAEGVGRGEAHWNETLHRDLSGEPPEDPRD